MKIGVSIAVALAIAMPSTALLAKGWTVMAAHIKAEVAKGRLKVIPANDWNRSSSRPSNRGESWTRDGITLNELTFYAGIKPGEAIFRQGYELDKELPRFKAEMLPTDLVELFEASNRMLLQSSVFKVELTEPAKLGGHNAVRFRYSYAAQNEDLPRKGEGVAAIIDGELHIVNFIAPALFFFDRDIGEVRKMIETTEVLKADEKDS